LGKPDFEQARRYALTRLERELSPRFYYHSLAHTRDDVVAAVERLAQMEGVQGSDWIILLTAAYYHDIGFCLLDTSRYQENQHEALSFQIAAQALPSFGYTPEQVETIQGIIMATQIPQKPQTLLEAVMADADLDQLGREDFWERSQALREEQAAFGMTYTELEWYRSQETFLSSHRYFTRAARGLRNAQKRRNLLEVRRRLKRLEAQPG